MLKNYRKLYILLILIPILIIACDKVDLQEAETVAIAAYIEALRNADTTLNIDSTESGLYYIVTNEGVGVKAEYGNVVNVNYIGRLTDGTVFDTTEVEPIKFVLGDGKVIQGLDEGVALMAVGGITTFIIPSKLAYGDNEVGTLPAYSTLIFDTELISIE